MRLERGPERARVYVTLAGGLTLLAIGFGVRERAMLAPFAAQLAPAVVVEMQAQLDDFILYLGVGGFVCGAAIALAAWTLALAPLHALVASTRAMKRDLATRTRVTGSDEIGRLGEALDDLASWIATDKGSLEEDRNRLRAILESMVEGVLVTGPDGRIVLANAALREMLLIDRTIVGRPPMEAIRVAGLDELLETASISDQPAAGEIELGGLRPRRLLVRATPLLAPPRATRQGDAELGLVAVFNDVTELRRLERIRRDFVANVSHELRTPIAAISAATETLDGGAIRDPAMGRELVAIIGRHAIRLRQLVEDLLELSRLESKEWRFDLQSVGVRASIDGAFEAVAIAAEKRGARLVHGVTDATLAVRADRRALEQVLVNLVENAVKYAGPKATVRVDAKVERSADAPAGEGARASILVSDNGRGIEPRHLPRLFERFYRVDAGRSRAVGGTGLGLAIVKHLVEAMHGVVEVESEVGIGTTFRVRLPLAVEEIFTEPTAPPDA